MSFFGVNIVYSIYIQCTSVIYFSVHHKLFGAVNLRTGIKRCLFVSSKTQCLRVRASASAGRQDEGRQDARISDEGR